MNRIGDPGHQRWGGDAAAESTPFWTLSTAGAVREWGVTEAPGHLHQENPDACAIQSLPKTTTSRCFRHGDLGGGPRAGLISRPCPDCWTRSAGRSTATGPAPGGDGATCRGGSRDRAGRREDRGEKTPRKKSRKKTMVLDVDGLPEGPWASPGPEANGTAILSPADVPRVGRRVVNSSKHGMDLIDGEDLSEEIDLDPQALKLTLRVVDRCRGRLCGSMIVRMDAGFPEPGAAAGAGVARRALHRSNPQE